MIGDEWIVSIWTNRHSNDGSERWKDGHVMVARNQKERDIDIGLDGGGADFRNCTLGLRVRREFFLVFFREQRRKFLLVLREEQRLN